jgi:hypothetical protein
MGLKRYHSYFSGDLSSQQFDSIIPGANILQNSLNNDIHSYDF